MKKVAAGMDHAATRLFAVAMIVVGVWGVTRWLGVAPTDVELPDWSVKDMPYELGSWHGEEIKMDKSITAAIGASVVVERAYRIEGRQPVTVHTAMFKNPADGVYHNPVNCYTANGWKRIGDSMENMQVADGLKVPVSVITWENKDGERLLVAFWYQLGNRVVHDRIELGLMRPSMRGRSAWPALIKVMAQIRLGDSPQDAKKNLMEFTAEVGKWLNQPDHQKYLAQWPGV